MGGFGTGGTDMTVSGQVEYYYNYFWEIINLFETPLRNSNALLNLKDATLPTFNVNRETYSAGSGLEYKFAKSIHWDDIKVAWYDAVGLLDVIKSWRESVWTKDCGLGAANDYKRNSTINVFLPTGKTINQWQLFNSWPAVIKYGELTYTSSDIKLIEVTVSYDWAEETADA